MKFKALKMAITTAFVTTAPISAAVLMVEGMIAEKATAGDLDYRHFAEGAVAAYT